MAVLRGLQQVPVLCMLLALHARTCWCNFKEMSDCSGWQTALRVGLVYIAIAVNEE